MMYVIYALYALYVQHALYVLYVQHALYWMYWMYALYAPRALYAVYAVHALYVPHAESVGVVLLNVRTGSTDSLPRACLMLNLENSSPPPLSRGGNPRRPFIHPKGL